MFKNPLDILAYFAIFAASTYAAVGLSEHLGFLTFTLLHLGPITAFLFVRERPLNWDMVKIVLIFSLIGSTLLDYIAETNGMWTILKVSDLRYFGVVPPEVFAWGFLFVMLPPLLYSRFVESERKKKSNPPKYGTLLRYMLIVTGITMVATAIPIEETFGYSYMLVGGVLAGLGTYRMVKADAAGYLNMLKVVLLIFPVFLVHEVVAVNAGVWSFDGSYVHMFNLFGADFPLEEVLLWMILSVPICVGVYKKFR